jgi:cellulose synthase/poly-beta-1,6-N-acetylglucosamine synthase-like glycosyltransferase
MRATVELWLRGFNWFVLVYFLVLNSSYMLLILLAARETKLHVNHLPFAGHDDIFRNPLTPPVSIVVPAFNEEAGIVESVRALLALRYPQHEIVVVEDGSVDRTFEVLRDAFDLVEVPKVIPQDVPTVGAVRSVHAPRRGDPLVVIRKENSGRKSDATNVGINACSYPLVCFIDADALLDEEALLRVAKPFVDDPLRVVATGGCIRAVNGSTVYRGRVVDARMPRRWLERIQVIEYIRAFLMGRTGWSRLQGLLIISGAFGLFRRDLVVQVDGFDLHSVGEDTELVTRMHRVLRAARRPYRVVFVAEPVCWTEVPGTLSSLHKQRRRWSRGLTETLRKHRVMMLNPRYGRIGLFVMPYYFLFELITPLIEILGIVTVSLGLALGVVDVTFGLLFLAASLGYGMLLSIAALTVEEFSYHRYRRWRDLVVGFVAMVLENVGFRQLHAWWRLQGVVDAFRGTDGTWATIPRTGFDERPAPDRRDTESVGAEMR